MPAPFTRPVSLVALGITLFLAALAFSWLEDVLTPWVNLGEAQMGSAVAFNTGSGRYRVVISGPARPALERVACDITFADESTKRALGGTGGVNPKEHFGVSRALEFRAKPGTTRMTCANRIVRGATLGRYQVVAADGPVSKAILAAFVFGTLSVLAGGLWLLHLFRRREDPPVGPLLASN